jgi:hypothetical protein
MLLRAAAVTAAAGAATFVASPAFAEAHRDDGDDPGKGISTIQTVGLFVLIPIVVIALIYITTFVISYFVQKGKAAKGEMMDPAALPNNISAWVLEEQAGHGGHGGGHTPALPGGHGTTDDSGGSSARW